MIAARNPPFHPTALVQLLLHILRALVVDWDFHVLLLLLLRRELTALAPLHYFLVVLNAVCKENP